MDAMGIGDMAWKPAQPVAVSTKCWVSHFKKFCPKERRCGTQPLERLYGRGRCAQRLRLLLFRATHQAFLKSPSKMAVPSWENHRTTSEPAWMITNVDSLGMVIGTKLFTAILMTTNKLLKQINKW